MKHIHYILAGLVGVFAANVQAATITYSLVNNAAYQSGLTLSGSITTDGTIGALGTENITAWSWTFTNALGNVVASSAGGEAYDAVNVTATEDEILVPQLGGKFNLHLGNGNKGLFWSGDPAYELFPGYSDPARRSYEQYDNPAQQFLFSHQGNPALTSTQSGQWIVAQAVPEPTAAALLGLGALVLIKRRKR
ncbi:MAG: PEP-CTERM sorting domain-containing protein [Verrucomicrobiota bacterium]